MGWSHWIEQRIGADLDDVFAYRTSRTLRIRDRWLGLAYYVLVLGIFCYIFVYQVGIRQQYLREYDTVGVARLQLQQPTAPYRWADADAPYCAGGRGGGQAMGENYHYPRTGTYEYNGSAGGGVVAPQLGCLYLDENLAVPQALDANAIFLTTRLSRTTQEVTPSPACDAMGHSYCSWAADANGTQSSFIADVEMFSIWIDHSVVVPALGISRTAAQMSGYIEAAQDVDPCAVYAPFAAGCPPFVAVGVQGKRDIVAVKTLLQAAGIASLDQVSGTDDALSNETLRYGGLILVINIDYSNYYVNTGSFNTSDIRYTYRVTVVRNSEFKAEQGQATGGDLPAARRVLVDMHGVRIIVYFTSNVGAFDAQTLLINLTVSFGLISVAVLVIDFVSTTLLPLRHIYRQYKERVTIDFSELRKVHGDRATEVLSLFRANRSNLIEPEPDIFRSIGFGQDSGAADEGAGEARAASDAPSLIMPLINRSRDTSGVRPAAALMLATLLAAASAAPASSALAPLPRPDYIGFIAEQLPLADAAFKESSCFSHGRATTPCNGATSLAALHATFWEATGNFTYVPRASSLMRTYVASWANATANGTLPNLDDEDFFAGAPLAIAMRGLVRVPGGLDGWAAVDVANVKRAMTDECSPEMRGAWNQAMSRAVGTAIALEVFPELDVDGSWLRYAADVFGDWTSAHAYAENSPVYNAIFFDELFLLGEALSPAIADADARSAPTLEFCAHYRDLVSPTGFLSTFGDTWSGAGVNSSIWGPFEMAYFWASAFERCATAAQQASGSDFADAASYSWAAAAAFFSATGGWQSGEGAGLSCASSGAPAGPVQAPVANDLRRLVDADVWRRRQQPPVSPALAAPPFTSSLVVRRKPPIGEHAPDKLVLTPDRTPGSGAPYVVAELWHASVLYHTHIQQVGATTYYSSNFTTFLRHGGRDNPLPEMGATAMMLWRDPSNASAFPFRAPENFIKPSEWVLAEQPTSHLSPWPTMAPADFFQRNLSHLHWFVNNERGDGQHIELSLACVHLFNPNTGAIHVIDDFVDVDYAWPNASIAKEAGAPGPTQMVLTISCGPGQSNNTRPQSAARPLGLVFDAREDFQLLRFYWRFSANTPVNSSALFTVTTGPYTIPEGDYVTQPVIGSCYDFAGVGYGAGTAYPTVSPPGAKLIAEVLYPSFAPNVTDAFALPLSAAGDSLGGFTVRGHFSSGVTWQRQLVLLAEGTLLAFDALTVAHGDAAEGWLAGPSFNLQLLRGSADLSRVAGFGNVFDAGGFNNSGCFGNGDLGESSNRLLVALFATSGAGAAGAVVGNASAWFVGSVHVATPFVRVALSAEGGAARFVSVLQPHARGPAESPALAAAIHVARGAGTTQVSVALPAGGAATVALADDSSSFSVTRVPQ